MSPEIFQKFEICMGPHLSIFEISQTIFDRQLATYPSKVANIQRSDIRKFCFSRLTVLCLTFYQSYQESHKTVAILGHPQFFNKFYVNDTEITISDFITYLPGPANYSNSFFPRLWNSLPPHLIQQQSLISYILKIN